ncbi:hypothetical protein ACFS5N_02200 [Mucilaginibacter ximonensis]|uniref:Uncharacterized protein n=1 Tax=Mucilaginibacter ximonensis TaxID=538021 RepID=A0ABW5Y908_9SPHI
MKKINLLVLATAALFSAHVANAQDNDTSKNKIEVKKKVKTGVHGRQVTKIKVEGKGTPEAIGSVAATATTGKTNVVVAQPAAPAQVVVVNPQPKPAATTVTTSVTKPAPTVHTTTTTTTHTATNARVVAKKPVHSHIYHKPAVTTTTTTTVKKE